MLTRLEIPEAMHRNAPGIAAAGYEHTGQTLIDLATRCVGLEDLEGVDVLDVGCGVRFTMTIINRGIPIGSYTGVEVNAPIVDFLKDQVQAHDERFEYVRWNVYNELYNPEGVELATERTLPVEGSFDLLWLFSVFTHLNPEDALALLRLLRRHVRSSGRLFFSAFIDDDLDGFEDRVKDQPLLNAYYGRNYMRSLVEQAGWRIDAFHDKDPDHYIQHHLVCSPS